MNGGSLCHLLLAIWGSVLVSRASVVGWCRWMLQENLRVAGGSKQPKRYCHSPTPRFVGTSPIEPAICTRDSSSSRPKCNALFTPPCRPSRPSQESSRPAGIPTD
ncbi:hypothetical protein F5882DRAFT_168619 [Hyaloscypha sp. PMI_1271]|nr:hypothetical protein F5882DRAFT_168619 [Hyaloscypha sp. PMI_1271]